VAETRLAIQQGAAEIDMVLNIGRLRPADLIFAEGDIHAVGTAAAGAPAKVILETPTSPARRRPPNELAPTSSRPPPACRRRATMDDLRLMRASVSKAVHVKAAGGVRSLHVLLAVADIGVTRFGAAHTSRKDSACPPAQPAACRIEP
jgi:deoxyribose-phosphate aldolase